MSNNSTPQEKMVVYLARELHQHKQKQALIGIGLPILAAKLVKELWYPDFSIIIENGSFDAVIEEIPFSLFGPRISYGCSAQMTNAMALAGLKRGEIKMGVLGGAQVDKYGNINTTHIGPIENMKARITGSGGAVDIGCYCETALIAIAHSLRTLVDQVDYVTTPGWICPDNSTTERKWVKRESIGLKGGPRVVITNLGIMRFDKNGLLYLDQYYPGVTTQQIKENTGFDIDVSQAKEAAPVLPEELDGLRTKVDPLNLYKTRQ